MKVFLSYNRADAVMAKSIADDVESLGHTVWYDREISGGQSWWNAILRQIRESDLFILAMTQKSLNSEACRAEFDYAERLNKRIMPVLCHAEVRINLLPPELMKIQFVDYCAQDKNAAFALVRALQHLPEAVPPPQSEVPEPAVPQSYLGGLRVQIERATPLTLPEQSALLMQIRERLDDPELRGDALELLRLLRGRDDLLAAVERGIAEILSDHPDVIGRKRRPPAVKLPEIVEKTPAKEESEPHEESSECVVVPLTRTAVAKLVEQVAAAGEKWVLQAGSEAVGVDAQEGHLVVSSTFYRWTQKEFKILREKGWGTEGRALKGLAAGALGAFGVGTYGLGFGLLLNKKTREFVSEHFMSKRFPIDDPEAAAAAVREILQVIASEATEVLARRAS
jgi:TIR domain-containing protein